MTDNEYLYGDNVEVPEIPSDIVMRGLELLKDHLEELLDYSFYTRDAERCNAVIKAIDFWNKLNK